LQGAVEQARERWLAAKKSAKQAKQGAKQARRQFKDAKKVVKRAKQEMLAAANKLKSSVVGVRNGKARVKSATKAASPKQASKAAPPKPAKDRAVAKRRARRKPVPAEVVSTVEMEETSPVQQETSAT
jgi:hypothetical protein